ncbi:MAG TPA: protein-L-isoaspartate(D-aspartate) O-methyltransferase [Spirochaetota bacterium]|mgnify:CR=1 FL=1|nr:protein-L-isoaspartate(D-aspartate) O-methyltransferase [Spirochaetota bacterium]HPJ33931.1 protein-L-isoaspartate(D-aspartate) O-methyltransferase [Spirochaetota bacterium]
MNIDRKEIMTKQRERMIKEHLTSRDISDPRVIEAMRQTERERFIPDKYFVDAYGDHPLPIGNGQTISQPYIVALMSQLCEFSGDEKVLEIGCGSGYQAAILSRLAKEIYSIERIASLAKKAENILRDTGCDNVKVIHGDGYEGYPEEAPFDAIIITAAPEKVPQKLIEQLADNGRLVAPIGESVQKLIKISRRGDNLYNEVITYVRFVPMVKGFN